MKISNFIFCLFCAVSLSSCWVNTSVVTSPPRYKGNVYKKMVGMTKNSILQTMSAPDRTTSDGNGGEILIYEKRSTISNTRSSAASSSYTNSAAVAGYNQYGNPAAVGASQTNSGYNYASQTVVSEEKAYIHFFINNQGKCYKVNANVGDEYYPAKRSCVRVANKSLLWTLMPPITIFGIPVAIWYLCNRNKTKPCQ